MTRSELAWEFAELFAELDVSSTNTVLAKNIPLETLEFFDSYADSVAKAEGVPESTRKRLPNLLVLGYLLRVLEERLLHGDTDAT